MKTEQPETERLWTPLAPNPDEEIETYATELRRYLDGQVPEKVFLEFRLRHGVYGQRQPDVQMQRIKIPLGRLTVRQMEVLAEIAEEYAAGILHVTTRQDFQCHFVDILDTPAIFRRLAEVGITTREACGNTVRNVTACPYAGVCCDEAFDVGPYARAMSYFMLRHPDTQNFGRKFKISFSGCSHHGCALAHIHDIGCVARVRRTNGVEERGFAVYVGGGLGPVPYQAKLLDEFVPVDELLPLAQAIARVFARLGEKKNRSRARMKFVVAKLGIDTFRKTVLEERERLPEDPRRDALLELARRQEERPLKGPSELDLDRPDLSDAFRRWYRANVRPQKQPGYSVATIFLPLGDLTSRQMRELARLAKAYVGDHVVTTVSQNIIFRWVSNADLPELHRELEALKLAEPLADTIADITACPGTDSCKLGISSSRGLAGVLYREFARGATNGGPRRDVKIKISGCPNSCGQHHIGNIGFFGTSKRKSGRVAPLFQVLLGGDTEENAGAYGLMVGKVTARKAPEAVRRLTELYDREKQPGETFNQCMERLGKARVREVLDPLAEIGEEDEYYHDNRQPWQYVKSVGIGECAGEVVDQAEFLLEDAERLIFNASLELEANKFKEAADTAYKAMVSAAHALLSTKGLLLSDNYDPVAEFRKHFVETASFFPGFAEYFFKAAEEDTATLDAERARQRVEEANLFVEEAEVAYGRMAGSTVK